MARPQVFKTASTEDWDRIVAASSAATFFHTSEWYRVVSEVYPAQRPTALCAITSDGAEVLLPLMSTWRSDNTGATSYISGPLFTYGGPVSAKPVSASTLTTIIMQASKTSSLRAASIEIVGNPYSPIPLSDPFRPEAGYAHVVDLTGGTDAVRARYQRSQREGLNKARRFGLTVRIGRELSDWRAYFDLYQQSLARWGERATSDYPLELFERLARCDGDAVRLWLVESSGTPCAGAIVVYKPPRACSWHAAFAEESRGQKPNNLLQDAILADASERGFLTYDLLSSGSNEGVIKFKEYLGAARLDYTSHRWSAGLVTTVFRFGPRRVKSLFGMGT